MQSLNPLNEQRVKSSGSNDPHTMSTDEVPETFTVQVKVAADNQDLSLPLLHGGVSVRQLKELISEAHPLHPHASQMKLIFAGRILQDSSLLQEIFGLVGKKEVYIIHLILHPSFVHSTASERFRAPPSSSPIPSSSSTPPPPFQGSPSFPFTFQAPSSQPLQSQSAPPHAVSLAAHISIPQILYINGLPYLAVNYPQTIPSGFHHSSFPSSHPIHPEDHHEAQPEENRLEGDQPNRENAAEADRNENDAQDQFDFENRRPSPLWLVIRLLFLVYIFSQNATEEKIFIHIFLASFIFVYQMGFIDPFIIFRRIFDSLRSYGNDHSARNRGPLIQVWRAFVAFFASLLPNIEFSHPPEPPRPQEPSVEADEAQEAEEEEEGRGGEEGEEEPGAPEQAAPNS